MKRADFGAAIAELLRDFHVEPTVREDLFKAIMRAADQYAARCVVNGVSIALTGKPAK